MKKYRITRILIEGSPSLPDRLAREILERYDVAVVKAPENSLVLTKARDSVSQEPFYLTEALVTECTVSIEGTFGYGILMGDRPELAYRLAVADAAYNRQLPETLGWEALLLAEEQELLKRRLKEQELTLATKVEFETMEESYDRAK
ncbi:phosphonate C-P lyase system protein PhnG [Paenibacillus sp. MWE-103]|uniref:Phosphonate C-P lyase system protein PhnG n=1 Tax=Paenibacillus artemisiicola TaxID=1172618 RepID=A0ABS3WC49_9BACL|nr:phosphonate C-P lyase system protein PhnG [Paenibacillus artemisiicola]MBO7745874.1 phosphonate C-P lyase system protein PhnG [Paenibacillus artemisiicola]